MSRVLIAGAGPVGLTVALALARAGVDALVLERREELSAASRASTFHPPTLEVLDGLGVLAPLLPKGQRVDRIAYLDSEGREAAAFDLAQLAAETRFPFRWHMEQSGLTPALLAALPPGAAVRFGAEVVGVRQDADGVDAVLVDGRAVRGAYLLGCDGARSPVREIAGIPSDGAAYGHRVLRVMTQAPLEAANPALGGVSYVHLPDGSCSLLRMPDVWRIIFRVPAEETDEAAQDPARVAARVRKFLPWAPDPLPVAGTDVYGVARRVARGWRSGRVLVLGDAAHVTNTRGGMNMNAGLHDASTLGGVLAAVLAGRTPELALDRWAAVRETVAREALVARTDRAVTETGPALLARMAALALDREAARSFLREGAMLDIARAGALDGALAA